MKVAKLVWASIGTRVIVEDTDTDEQIWAKAFPHLIENLTDSQMDSCESIEDDKEIPYGDKYSDC